MALQGNEILFVTGIVPGLNQPSGQTFQTTTQAIANLASLDTTQAALPTLTTTTNTTITAALFVQKNVVRSGPTAAFTDTTDTSADIIAALPGSATTGTAFGFTYINTSTNTAIISGGVGVTMAGVVVAPPSAAIDFFVALSSPNSITMTGKSFSFESNSSSLISLAGTTSGYTTLQTTAAASGVLTLPAATDQLVGRATTDTLTHKTLTDAINTDTVYGSGALTAVSTTTLALVPGLYVPLTTSGTYSIYAAIPVSANAAGGISIAAAASNSLTSTAFQAVGKFTTAAAVVAVNTTNLGGNVSATNATVLAELIGSIVVNTGGTLIIEAAQSVSTSATTTIALGGTLSVTRIS